MTDNKGIARMIEERKRKAEQDNETPVEIQGAQVKASLIVWMLGAVLVDVVSAAIIWRVLYWWYAIGWFLAGAGGLVYSEWLRTRIGNNRKQRDIGNAGVVVSAVMVILMALVAGYAFIRELFLDIYVENFTLFSVIFLFGYNIFRSYRYHNLDDAVAERNAEAREVERHEKEMRSIERARREVEAMKEEDAYAAEYRREHGEAFDAARGGRRDYDKPVESREGTPLTP